MFCPNCGKEIETGTKFCGSCGKEMSTGNVEAPPATSPRSGETSGKKLSTAIMKCGSCDYTGPAEYAITSILEISILALSSAC